MGESKEREMGLEVKEEREWGPKWRGRERERKREREAVQVRWREVGRERESELERVKKEIGER